MPPIVITLVLSAPVSKLYLVQVLARLSARASSSCFPARPSIPNGIDGLAGKQELEALAYCKWQVGNISAVSANLFTITIFLPFNLLQT